MTTPSGSSCGSTCATVSVVVGTQVTLTPTPNTGFSVLSWAGGNCETTPGDSPCSFVPGSDTSVTVTFCPYNYVVSEQGSDRNRGTCVAPFRTISKALGLASVRQIIKVDPGTYDGAGGETFPMEIPGDVALIGDETDLGQDTIISGGGPVSGNGASAAIHPGTESTVAGFTIRNTASGSGNGVVITTSSVVIRSNTISGSNFTGIYFPDPAGVSAIIRDNVISGNGGNGIMFFAGGQASLVEGNTITDNDGQGVEVDNCAACVPDLGGGAASSQGGNTITCNHADDIWAQGPATSETTLAAKNNFFDHATPTAGCGGGKDLCNAGNVTFDTTGAAAASSTCP
jgi:hypothetical protein